MFLESGVWAQLSGFSGSVSHEVAVRVPVRVAVSSEGSSGVVVTATLTLMAVGQPQVLATPNMAVAPSKHERKERVGAPQTHIAVVHNQISQVTSHHLCHILYTQVTKS